MKHPRISILIPSYHHRFFEAALESALAQDYFDFEVLVCDDSDDGRIEAVCDRYRGSPLVYRRNPENLGFHGNFAQCFRLARGDYIKFLNDDDLLNPSCLRTMAPYLDDPTLGVSLVTSRRNVIDAAGRILQALPATATLSLSDRLFGGTELGNMALVNSINVIGEPSTTMFRKADVVWDGSDLFRAGGTSFTILADLVLWLRLLARGKCAYIASPQSSFRQHEHQEQKKSTHLVGIFGERIELLKYARTMGYLHGADDYKLARDSILKVLDQYIAAPVVVASKKKQLRNLRKEFVWAGDVGRIGNDS